MSERERLTEEARKAGPLPYIDLSEPGGISQYLSNATWSESISTAPVRVETSGKRNTTLLGPPEEYEPWEQEPAWESAADITGFIADEMCADIIPDGQSGPAIISGSLLARLSEEGCEWQGQQWKLIRL